MQRGAFQADRAQRLAAQLRQVGKDMQGAGTRRSDATVASLLRFGQRLFLVALALDMPAPAFALELRLAFAVNVSLVGIDVAAGIGRIDHRFEVSCSLAVLTLILQMGLYRLSAQAESL